MSDIVKKYQHYFAESVKLQETVNEQAAYIEELEEAVTTLSEIFDSPEGKEALASYRVKAAKSLSRARDDRKEAEDDAHEITHGNRGGWGAALDPERQEARNNARKSEAGRHRAVWQGGSRTGGTIEDAQDNAMKAFKTIQSRKAGIKRAEKIHNDHQEAIADAESKARGWDRNEPHVRDERGFLMRNPYFKERSVEDTPPRLQLTPKPTFKKREGY
jgi:hypothetical protein